MHRIAAAFLVVTMTFLAGTPAPAWAEKRVALVIGNSAYEHATPLKNARNDADTVSAALENLGFEVVKGVDLTYAAMRRTVRDFAYKLENADTALFFYAGHGLQVKGANYLVPGDARLDKEIDLDFEAIRLRTVLAHMERSAKTNLVFLDACRDNPMARNLARSMGTRSSAIGRGLARVESGVGTLIAFATQPGNVALDGNGTNSPFTKAFVKHVGTPGLDVALVMRRVREEVIAETNGAQVPWNNSSLTGSFVFQEQPKDPPKPAAAAPAIDNSAIELAFWQSAKEQDTRKSYEVYLRKFPQGNFAPLAELKLDELRRTEAAAAAQKAELAAARKKQAEAEAAKRAAEAKRNAERETTRKMKAADEAKQRKAEANRREQEMAELVNKQEAERERLEQERQELATRLKTLEEQAHKRAEAENARQKKMAALQPETATVSAPALDPEVMALVLQNELRRVGCDPGKVDGAWGKQGMMALGQFNIYAKLKLSTEKPTIEAVDAIRGKKERVCPLVCDAMHRIEGDQCVKKTCGSGQQLNNRGLCVRVAVKPTAKPTGKPKTTKKKVKYCNANPGYQWLCPKGTVPSHR